MASPFESKDGLSWADQWDYKSDISTADEKKQSADKKFSLSEYNKKIKSAASTGVEKAKVAASSGAKKVKSGTSSGVQWIKEQMSKTKAPK
jgi:hypothetical protein